MLSALGRLHRAGALTAEDVTAACDRLARLPLTRHLLVDLLPDAWACRATLRLVDALYIALGTRLGLPVLTTDHRLARASAQAEAITG